MRNKEVTSKIMASIKSKDTKPEKMLGSALWALGLRYRKHYKVEGIPDFVLVGTKLAIFCDGDFWHGKNWKIKGMANLEEELESYKPYWKNKIIRNIERDNIVNQTLSDNGWKVLRFWESEIKQNSQHCAQIVFNEHIGRRKEGPKRTRQS